MSSFPVSVRPKVMQDILMSSQSLLVSYFFEELFHGLVFSIIKKWGLGGNMGRKRKESNLKKLAFFLTTNTRFLCKLYRNPILLSAFSLPELMIHTNQVYMRTQHYR